MNCCICGQTAYTLLACGLAVCFRRACILQHKAECDKCREAPAGDVLDDF